MNADLILFHKSLLDSCSPNRGPFLRDLSQSEPSRTEFSPLSTAACRSQITFFSYLNKRIKVIYLSLRELKLAKEAN